MIPPGRSCKRFAAACLLLALGWLPSRAFAQAVARDYAAAYARDSTASAAFGLAYALGRPAAQPAEVEAAVAEWQELLAPLRRTPARKLARALAARLSSRYLRVYDPTASLGEAVLAGRYSAYSQARVFTFALEELGGDYALWEAPDHEFVVVAGDLKRGVAFVPHPDCATGVATRLATPMSIPSPLHYALADSYLLAAAGDGVQPVDPSLVVAYTEAAYDLYPSDETQEYFGQALLMAAQADEPPMPVVLSVLAPGFWLAAEDSPWAAEAKRLIIVTAERLAADTYAYRSLDTVVAELAAYELPDEVTFELWPLLRTVQGISYAQRGESATALRHFGRAGAENIPLKIHGVVREAITEQAFQAVTDEAALDTLRRYARRFPWFATSRYYDGARAYVEARRVVRLFESGDPAEGLSRLEALEHDYPDLGPLGPARGLIGSAYAAASSHYVRERDSAAALRVLERGLHRLPEHVELLRKRKLLTDAAEGRR